MNFDFEIRHLTSEFYTTYLHSSYPEIEHKPNRPYSCLIFELAWLEDYFVCIPFRSHLNIHNGFCYRFRHSLRSRSCNSGLDYQKMVIVKSSYIGSHAIVDRDEFTEMRINMFQIQNEVIDFIETYIHHINGTKPLHIREFTRRYHYSTLPYFHAELGLP